MRVFFLTVRLDKPSNGHEVHFYTKVSYIEEKQPSWANVIFYVNRLGLSDVVVRLEL